MGISSHFRKFLAIDCETSGMARGPNPAVGYQMVSVGLIVSDTKDYKEYDKRHFLIKWNGESEWDQYAEKIHGMSKEWLEENGQDEEDVVMEIIEFIMEHFDVSKPIVLCGHNVVNFDKAFLVQLFDKYGFDVKFSHRAIDSFPLGLVALGAYDSNELFDTLGFPKRKEHNALQDIELTLKAIRMINTLVKQCIDNE